jgi:hypothetical protein
MVVAKVAGAPACMVLMERFASRIFAEFDGRRGGSVLSCSLQGSFRDYLVKLRVDFHDKQILPYPFPCLMITKS